MNQWIEVATADELAATGKKVVYVEGERISLYKIGDAIYAIGDICTHAHAFLSDGGFEDHKVICPLHGSQFDLRTGAALTMPAVVPVATYPVKLEAGKILIQFDV